jgi:hypothetical protein
MGMHSGLDERAQNRKSVVVCANTAPCTVPLCTVARQRVCCVSKASVSEFVLPP